MGNIALYTWEYIDEYTNKRACIFALASNEKEAKELVIKKTTSQRALEAIRREAYRIDGPTCFIWEIGPEYTG